MSNSHSQVSESGYVISDSVQIFEVNNNQIFLLLDSITENLCDCIFYKLERDYFYRVVYNNKLNKIWVEILSIEDPFILKGFEKLPRNSKGMFIYNDHLVLIVLQNPINNDSKDELFKVTDSISKVQYVLKEYLPLADMGYESIVFSGTYDPEKCKIFIDHKIICDKRYFYCYNVSKKDTWEELSRKFQVPIDELKTIKGVKYNNLILKKGDFISGEYLIVDGKLRFNRTR